MMANQVCAAARRAFSKVGLSLCCCLSSFFAHQVQASPVSTIQTPPAQAIESLATVQSLQELTLANLIATNCEVADLQAGDAALIAGTAQTVASHMGLGVDEYFANYLHTALARVSEAGACEKYAATARNVAEELKALGGAIIE